jgi:alpha-L-fucosidase
MRTTIHRMMLAAVLWAGMPVGVRASDPTTSAKNAPDLGAAPASIPDPAHDARMGWWREARFGMFIHWGLYAIPAGEWPGRGNHHGEWIRDSAKIPLDEYATLAPKFNPVKFDADAWVRLAQDAGMRYLVITSKHHDGFCLFDSKHTEWDVMSTPFKRDIMKELSAACKRSGVPANGVPGAAPVRFCMYHSIMDWHHPDYLPRRPWEKETRGTDGADFDRFVAYLKNQLTELCTPTYDPGVLWFDGEWESTWTSERGKDLFTHMRTIAPGVIVNNRIDKGRAGMEGSTAAGFLGDYATPEQTIPERGLPGDWETCMTMNGNWGYNAVDKDFKSTQDLVRKLCDITSKGGNFLLNVGPTAEGEIPAESVQRLKEIGAWMRVNGAGIHGTERSPLASVPAWGRVTMKRLAGEGGTPMTRLYLHVFERPADGKIVLEGVLNELVGTPLVLAADSGVAKTMVSAKQVGGAIEIDASGIPASAWIGANPAGVGLLTIDLAGAPDMSIPPTIEAFADQFVTSADVTITMPMPGVEIRYTGDGKEPDATSRKYESPLSITKPMTIKARGFRRDKPVTTVASRTFIQAPPRASVVLDKTEPGLDAACYIGEWDKLPDFATLKPEKNWVAATIGVKDACREEGYGLHFSGYLRVPTTQVYTITLGSDDGSRLILGSGTLIDHDGTHSFSEKSATLVLAGGWHPITVEMFNKKGGADLVLSIASPDVAKKPIDAADLARAAK